MKQFFKLCMLAILFVFASCEKESASDSTLEQNEVLFEKEIIVSDGEEDPELQFTETSERLVVSSSKTYGNNGPEVAATYTVIDADRAPYGHIQPVSNFWWSNSRDADDYFNPDTYYGAAEGENLVFTEYTNGTANLVGTTISGTCTVELNVWFKHKKDWAEWQAIGGEHKKEGVAGLASNSADMNFYLIDHTRSTVTASGGDCIETGTFGLVQRPDPNDPNTPNYGTHIGPGGANYDSNIGAFGLSTWGTLIDPVSCLPISKPKIDFNFRLELNEEECNDCEGKVTDLTLNWDWHNDYRVRVYQRYENTCYATKIFDETVGAHENFSFSGANSNGTIGKWAYIFVGNCYYTKIRTNCDLEIGPGYVKGVLEVVSGNSSHGGELCEYVPEDNYCHRHWRCRYRSHCRYY